MTAPNTSLKASIGKQQAWQEDAWRYYDEIGELRFGSSWIANAMSRVNLVAATAPSGPGDEPTPVDLDDPTFDAVDRRAAEIVATMAGGVATQGQILAAMGLHLTIAGLCWLVIEPDPDDPFSDVHTRWEVYSSDEVKSSADGTILIRASEREWRNVHPDGIVVKVWRRHPRRSWEPDAPTHGVLGVLREIHLLTMHIQATAQSRLAGAGLLALPSEAVFPPGQGPQTSQSVDPDDENLTAPEDTFVDTLVEAMTVPIVDRGSAAAVVPLVVKIPGEHVDKIRHISFATPFDDRVLELLDGAIKRLALGMDIPPEILTGTSGMNHWGAWQVQEESITLHIEPLSETVVHAMTIGYLRPALLAEGFSEADVNRVMVWYDTTDLRTRPDRSAGAREAYDRNELSGAALLREFGLSVDDAPTPEEKREKVLLSIVRGAPTLAPALLAELGYLAAAPVPVSPIPAADVAAGDIDLTPDTPPAAPAEQSMPDTAPAGDLARPESASVASDALAAACHVVVHRALEKAGARLRSAAGKNVQGGAAAIACPDPTRLHVELDATAYSDLGALLEGAWTLIPEIATRCGVDSDALVDTLDAYTRALLAAGQEHSHDRLAQALGHPAVD